MELTTYRHLVIAVMVLTFTGNISGNCQVQSGQRNVKTFDSIKAISGSDCALYCKTRECTSYKYNSSDHSCQTIQVWKDSVVIVRSNEKDVQSFSIYEDDEWVKVFYFTAGTGVAVYNSFMGIGARSTWRLPSQCATSPCPEFFRSNLIDAWESLPIDQVKLVIYQNGNPAATMTFNGNHSTKSDWFTFDRVLSSPWNDVTRPNIVEFRIFGIFDRVFYMMKQHGGCAKDKGWIAVIEKQKVVCAWEKRSVTYPHIVFSNQRSGILWESTKFGIGDSMAVFIKLDASRMEGKEYSYFA